MNERRFLEEGARGGGRGPLFSKGPPSLPRFSRRHDPVCVTGLPVERHQVTWCLDS